MGDRFEDVVQGLQCAAAFAALEIFGEAIVAGVVTVQSRVVIFSNFGATRNVPNHHVLRFSVRVPQPFVVSLASGCRIAEERGRRLPVSEVTSYAEEAQFKGEASDPPWSVVAHVAPFDRTITSHAAPYGAKACEESKDKANERQ